MLDTTNDHVRSWTTFNACFGYRWWWLKTRVLVFVLGLHEELFLSSLCLADPSSVVYGYYPGILLVRSEGGEHSIILVCSVGLWPSKVPLLPVLVETGRLMSVGFRKIPFLHARLGSDKFLFLWIVVLCYGESSEHISQWLLSLPPPIPVRPTRESILANACEILVGSMKVKPMKVRRSFRISHFHDSSCIVFSKSSRLPFKCSYNSIAPEVCALLNLQLSGPPV